MWALRAELIGQKISKSTEYVAQATLLTYLPSGRQKPANPSPDAARVTLQFYASHPAGVPTSSSAIIRTQANSRLEKPIAAVMGAGHGQTTVLATSTKLNHSKPHAIKILTVHSGAFRPKTIEMAFAGTRHAQTVSQLEIIITPALLAAARSAASESSISAAKTLTTEARTRNSITAAGKRGPAKNTLSASTASSRLASGKRPTCLFDFHY